MDTALLEPIPLERAAHLPIEAVGGKASRLAKLRAAGFAVPDGFVLTTAVHRQATGSASTAPHETTSIVPDDLRPAFIDACDRLGYPIIVRSSAVGEDLATASFAGQFESVLHVHDAEEAIVAVLRCWHAATSAHLAAYRRASATADGSLALLVQRQLAPTSAGVAFGRDPVTGAERVIIEAVPGLSDRLLDGAVSPERWTVVDGTAHCEEHVAQVRALRPADALRVAAMVQRLGEIFDGPQDVEWAFVHGDLNVLQSRPITTIASLPVGASRATPSVPDSWLRDRMHWPDRISPFGADIFAPAAERGVRIACDTFGLLLQTAVLHVVDHRAYLEPVPVGGGRLPSPPPWLVPVLIRVIPQLRRRTSRAVDAVRTDAAGVVLQRWDEEHAPRLAAEIEARRVVDLAAMDVPEISEHLDDTIAFFMGAGALHYLAQFAQSQVLAEYAFLARDLLGWDPGFALSTLGARSSATSAASAALEEVARLLATASDSSTDSHGRLVSGTLAGETDASAALRAYLDRYGLRIFGTDPMGPTLAEAPEFLEPALEAAVDQARATSTNTEVRRDAGRRAALDATDPRSQEVPTEQRDRWRRVIERAERWYGARDESELLGIIEPLGLIRRVALELGTRLAAQGLLERPEDCFMLTASELRQSALGGSTPRQVAAARRREFDAAAQLPDQREIGSLPSADLRGLPPDARFANEAILWFLGSIAGEAGAAVPDGALVAGTPASAGTYRGPVRVIRGPDDFHRVRRGDVLVCPTTAPSWSAILGQVGAVVTDHGGMLSHPAIVAREFGIPAIVGTTDGTSILADGDVVLVDGTAGTVSR